MPCCTITIQDKTENKYHPLFTMNKLKKEGNLRAVEDNITRK